jgi:DNA-binding transcriptional regulator/RsmH inhibitor MraZ
VFQGPNCIEIWSEEVWNDYFNDISFEDLADAMDELSAKNG